MDISKPILTEPGVKYFLKETLKNCKIKKNTEFNRNVNLALLTMFILISCGLLYYKYKTKQHHNRMVQNLQNTLKNLQNTIPGRNSYTCITYLNALKQKKQHLTGTRVIQN